LLAALGLPPPALPQNDEFVIANNQSKKYPPSPCLTSFNNLYHKKYMQILAREAFSD